MLGALLSEEQSPEALLEASDVTLPNAPLHAPLGDVRPTCELVSGNEGALQAPAVPPSSVAEAVLLDFLAPADAAAAANHPTRGALGAAENERDRCGHGELLCMKAGEPARR